MIDSFGKGSVIQFWLKFLSELVNCPKGCGLDLNWSSCLQQICAIKAQEPEGS